METFLILVFLIVAFIAYQTMRPGGRRERRRWRFDLGRTSADARGAPPVKAPPDAVPGASDGGDAIGEE
jgi:hypothetical protein